MRVLVFGDSITQGYWAVEHGWVDRVRQFYDARQFADLKNLDEPTVFNLGISADNSVDILARIEAEILARTRAHHATKPVVLIQVGVNDGSTTASQPQVDLNKYAENLKAITAKVKPLTSKLVFVGFAACDEQQTNPVFWGEHYYNNDTIKKYEDAMAQVAHGLGLDFIPVFNQFKARLDEGKDLLPDGLHPNEAGHELMYDIIMPKLQELLI